MNGILRGCFSLLLVFSLAGCGGGQAVFPDYDTNQPNFDQPVQAVPQDKLVWTVAPTLEPENILPILSYRRDECLAASGVKFIQKGLCGVLDYAGNTVIEATYGDIVSYADSFLGLHTGEVPEQDDVDCFDMFHFGLRDSLPTVKEENIPLRSVWSSSSLCALHIDRDGRVLPHLGDGVFFAEQGEVYTDENGRIEVRGNGKFALIGNGNPITGFDFEDGGYLANGLLAAKKDGKWGFVDESGKTVIPFSFDEKPYHPTNGFVVLKKDGLFGYYRTDGKEVIPCVLEGALPVNNGGLAYAKTNGKWGVLRVALSSMGHAGGYKYPVLSEEKGVKCVSLESGVLNMRKTCDANGLILGTLLNGEEVTVFSEGVRISAADDHDWLFCGAKQRDGKWIFGYCYGRFLVDKEVLAE